MAEATQVVLEDVRLLFRNFEGREGQYNREGDRSFNIALDPQTAAELDDAGWNVRYSDPKEEGDEPLSRLEVAVNFRGKPPTIVTIGEVSKKRTRHDQHSAFALDHMDIVSADVIINPYHWNVSGNSGVKAYLESLYVIVREDPLELKYKDIGE